MMFPTPTHLDEMNVPPMAAWPPSITERSEIGSPPGVSGVAWLCMLGIRNLSRDNGLAAFSVSVSVEHGTEAEHYRYLFVQCLYGIGILSELANP